MMGLPAPNLDDRDFQNLVDEAKRRISDRCPEWTDHNVHDPGVTLIETFAYMVDQLLYRLNRVPDKMFVTFLNLLDLSLLPPTAARALVTFWLSAPRPEPLVVPAGTEVSTQRTESEDPVVFSTTADLTVAPTAMSVLATRAVGGDPELHEEEVTIGARIRMFSVQPRPDDCVLFGLTEAVPANVLVVRMDCTVEGVGVDPSNPPVVWEAWTARGWMPCEIDQDATGGFNRPGDVVLHVPVDHESSIVGRRRAAWIRCRIVPPAKNQPYYSASPTVGTVSAFTCGGTVEAVHASRISDDVLGVSNGVPGQTFAVSRPPVVPGGQLIVEVSDGAQWQPWELVPTFAESGPEDRHATLDATTGRLAFGPAVRQQDGSLRHFGAVPPKGAVVRVPSYFSGGGRRGNAARGALTVLRSSVPFVTRVENRSPARGGVDGETVEQAKVRGPLELRTRNRAVTAEDYEQLARIAAPDLARVRCVESGGGVRVLVVPRAADAQGRLRREDLIPSDATLTEIVSQLDARRVIGTRLIVEPPDYLGLTVIADLTARPRTDPDDLADRALEALYAYFNPVSGGPDGSGWPFGRPVQVGEVFGVLQGVRGTELVDQVRLYGVNLNTRARGESVQRIDLHPHQLVFSFKHEVRVEHGASHA